MIAANVFSIVCLLAAFLSYRFQRKEWAWFVFAAVLGSSVAGNVMTDLRPSAGGAAANAPAMSRPS